MQRSDVDMRQDVEMTAKIEKFVFRFFQLPGFFFAKIVECKFLFCENPPM